jgi:beta-glucosidase
MTSFNEVSGTPSTANSWLFNDILRAKWGFGGFVVTDYTAINELINHGTASDEREAGYLAFRAGIDMDMQGGVYAKHLASLIKDGRASMATLNQAVRRILIAKYKLGLFEDPYRRSNDERAKKLLLTTEHLNAARDVARRSIVLLKNQKDLLPLKRTATVALIGPLADNKRDVIGNWSAAGDWKQAVSLLEGMKTVAGAQAKILFARGANILDDKKFVDFLNHHDGQITLDSRTPGNMIKEAVQVAKKSDVVVMALGETQGMSGEAASRSRIRIPENQLALLRAVHATGRPIVLVLFNGRPLALEDESKLASSIVETWFLGTQSGNAIADVLFGDYNPSGKLTISFPVNEGQIPVYYSHKNTGRPANSSDPMEKYSSKYQDIPNEPLYPFGWGLSYTRFAYSEPRLSATQMSPNGKLEVRFTVQNIGKREGEETAQLYIHDLVASVTRPLKQLRGFQKLYLKPGETKEVVLSVTENDLKFYNQNMDWVTEPGDFEIMIGSNSSELKKTRFTLKAR